MTGWKEEHPFLHDVPTKAKPALRGGLLMFLIFELTGLNKDF
jgi:hypothetical protein